MLLLFIITVVLAQFRVELMEGGDLNIRFLINTNENIKIYKSSDVFDLVWKPIERPPQWIVYSMTTEVNLSLKNITNHNDRLYNVIVGASFYTIYCIPGTAQNASLTILSEVIPIPHVAKLYCKNEGGLLDYYTKVALKIAATGLILTVLFGALAYKIADWQQRRRYGNRNNDYNNNRRNDYNNNRSNNDYNNNRSRNKPENVVINVESINYSTLK